MVGTVYKLKIPSCLGNKEGAIGFCYETYQDFDYPDQKGESIIFENGNYDGFSFEERQKFLEKVGHSNALDTYKFTNVMQLTNDYLNGVFDLVLKYKSYSNTDGRVTN